MADYNEWNDAIINYFTNGVPRGAAIFLDIGEDTLADVGHLYLRSSAPTTTAPSNWMEDFKRAVRSKCTGLSANGQREIRLHKLVLFNSSQSESRPESVAFLAALVLAAFFMAEGEEIADHNYFKRLREVLGIPGSGRPAGLNPRDEENRWLEWQKWLQREGFLPTAHSGSGARYYVSYPISQSLLRRTDRDRLFQWFSNKNWAGHLDRDRVGGRLRHEVKHLTQHLRELLQENGTQRYQVVNQALFEVYQDWLAGGRRPALSSRAGSSSGAGSSVYSHSAGSGMLFAGLYREVSDPFEGTVRYYLYPEQPRKLRLTGPLQVEYRDQLSEELVEERRGWYDHLSSELDPTDLSQGLRCKLSGSIDLQYLVLPNRDFWILTADPDYPETGNYATWEGSPGLGTPFLLLCKSNLQPQLTRLKDEGRLEWQGRPRPLSNYPGWVEYHGMLVLSEAWAGISIEDKDLFEALRPKDKINLGFEGGLRLAERHTWLEGFGPQVTVFAFAEKVELRIRKTDSDTPFVHLVEVDHNQPQEIKWPEAGNYLVEAWAGPETCLQPLRLEAWSSLPLLPAERQHQASIRIGAAQVYGPLIEVVKEPNDD